jgi:anti-anti-sigma factor
MNWSEEMRNGVIVATPRGRIDESTAQKFADDLAASVERTAEVPSKKLVLHLASIDYMSSRGLRALTLAKRKADATGVKIALAAPTDIMREILAISRYDKLFAVSDTIEGAL